MWARVVEIMLGLWLCASPFIFQHPESAVTRWYTDLGCAFLVMGFSLLSYLKRFEHVHLGAALVGLWLMGFGYVGSAYPAPPALQNDMVVGLLLTMIAIIPNEASKPPASWRKSFPRPGARPEQESVGAS